MNHDRPNGTPAQDIILPATLIPAGGIPAAALAGLSGPKMVDIAQAVLAYGQRDLERVQSIEELLDQHRKTAAIEDYITHSLRDREHQLDAQNAIAELRLRQERKIGEWLATRPRHPGGKPVASCNGLALPPSYAELGIERTQAHRFQREARVPEEVFTQHVEATKQAGQELTSAGLLKLERSRDRAAAQSARRAAPAEGGTVAELVDLAGSTRFATLYADPPWAFDNTVSNGAAANHYRTLPEAAIAALPVAELALPDAHLHLWVPTPLLPEGLRVLAAWGFAYKGFLAWVKGQMGTGNYWRSAVELLLLGVRGHCPFLDHGIRNWLEADRGRHSAKPEAIRQLVERVSPGPYLELFARCPPPPGWACWGDEVPPSEG
jgi:N6-adenosine-specific RNA methylase IME4